ncbi:MAG: type II toxin-antitoxin system RelE/ParE family toxin [Phycisphaerales bacterium]|jgi:toxin ParE1/3/4|nr:type II toxin-antitoxin system RelE/ParE family toxin [Phycisphaerales bacterium]
MNPRALRTDQAEEDLIDIWSYIADDNSDAADRLLDEIDKTCDTLADNPKLGRPREELSDGLRSLHVGNYVILYRSGGEGIIVIRVLHGARDLPEMF